MKVILTRKTTATSENPACPRFLLLCDIRIIILSVLGQYAPRVLVAECERPCLELALRFCLMEESVKGSQVGPATNLFSNDLDRGRGRPGCRVASDRKGSSELN